MNEKFNFDPMTGERIVNESTGKCRKSKSAKNGFPKIILGMAAGIVVLLIIVFTGFSSGLFAKPADKILLAAQKTVNKAENFLELNEVFSILKGKSFQVDCYYDYSTSYYRQNADIIYNHYGKEKGMRTDVYIGNESMMADILLTDHAVQVSFPDAVDDILYYDYTEKKTGYLVDEAGEDTIQFIDNILAYCYDNRIQEDIKNMAEDGLKVFRGLEFDKASEKSIEVNGKDRSCKGYVTTIGPDEMEEFADVYKNYYEKCLEALTKDCDDSELSDELSDSFEQIYNNIMDTIDNMEEFDMMFYLYKDQLVAICLESDWGEVIEYQINNSNNPFEKMTIIYDDGDEDYEINWEGDISDKKEEYTLSTIGSRLLTAEYDKNSGDVEIKIIDSPTINGYIDKKSDKITYAVEVEDEDLDFEISISENTEKIKLEGDKFDIGNASESELRDFAENFENSF